MVGTMRKQTERLRTSGAKCFAFFWVSHSGALEAPREAILYISERMTFIFAVPFQAFAVASLVVEGDNTIPHVTF